MCVCAGVRVGGNMRVREFVCVCVCMCVGVGIRARTCACERVALLIQYATRRRHIACGIFGSDIFFDVIS